MQVVADPNAYTLLALVDHEAMGLITAHLRYTVNHAAPIVQITLLVVDERARRHGVGRALVAAAEQWARDHGCRRIVVTTALHRAEAHAFYESVGYRQTGRRYGKDFSSNDDSHAV